MSEDSHARSVHAGEPSEEARYRATFHEAALGIAHAMPDGTLFDVNPALCAMLGRSRDELLGTRLQDLRCTAEHLSGSRAEATLEASAASSRAIGVMVERYVYANGADIWVQRTFSTVRDVAGSEYCIHFLEDITARKQNEQEQRLLDLRYRRTLEAALDCIVSTDHVGRIIEFNPMAEKVFGYARADVLGRKLLHVLVPPALRKRHAASMARLVSGDQSSMLNRRIETVALRADGSTIPVELMMQRISDADPPVFTGFLRDISARKAAEARILRLNRLYRILSHTSALVVRVREREELFREICRIARHQGGFSTPWVGLIDPDAGVVRLSAHAQSEPFDVPPVALDTSAAGEGGPIATAVREARVVVCDEAAEPRRSSVTSSARDGALAVLPLIAAGEVIGVFILKSHVRGYFDDDVQQLLREMGDEITYALERLQLEQKHTEAQQRLLQLSHYDQVTGLPNRGLLHERLAHGIAQAARNNRTLGVMFVDLDRFKRVNDTQGHAGGDELLKQVAARLLECVRAEDSVARLPGDEFAVVLTQLSDAADAAVVAAKLMRGLRQPYRLGEFEVVVSASIGISLYPHDGTSPDVLMRNADVAMYSAKARGRDNFQFYTAEMNARALAKLQLESRLRDALARDEFRLHYQPKVVIDSASICGFEALLRWQPPGRPLVPPGEFIPLLEESGLITPVGEWVVRAACAQLARWRDLRLRPVPVAINLSARQLNHAGFCEMLAEALRARALPPRSIEVEITESSLMENPDEARKALHDLKRVGVTLAIDDFGTGYSSLSYLQRFPFDTLKIDRSFVQDITTDPGECAIARAIITLAASLDLTSVAEGVETEAQLAVLSANGCRQAQGYLFSRPLSADAATALLAKDEPLASASGAKRRPSRV